MPTEKCVLKGCILNLPLKQSIRTKIYPLKITNLSLSVCTVLSLLIKSVLYGNSNDFSWYVSDNILMRCRTTASDIGTKYNSVNFLVMYINTARQKLSCFRIGGLRQAISTQLKLRLKICRQSKHLCSIRKWTDL